ncbi:SH2 domain-containing protein 7 [Micropterus dolomieu]|uniref:SH2 domain-containing protein 7 n=1 Tax=Micropterus dolomieu TaxID=147949 RepID=UPI001E8ED5DD|nr:SH2 domain-containing protein 7 [Micropterus dolomieu]
MEKKLDLHVGTSEGGLKELVLRWFTETQAPMILNNGNFPDWFQGFAARKDTEDLLRDKAQGCFLIRLSDKAMGYILSYKGHDRCRHFVITQNQDGQFVISGDCRAYGSLTELIEHYKVSPIQPFGEHLTSSCYEEDTGDLYDVVNYNSKGKPAVSVQALRSLWAQKNDHHNNQRIQQENDRPPVPPHPLPPKSQNRKLMGMVSVSPTQGVPPVPKRGMPLGFCQTGSLPETTPHPSETWTDPKDSELMSGDLLNTTYTSYPGDPSRPGLTYSELTQVESRSKSLPRLNNTEEDEYSNQLSIPSFTYSSAPLKMVNCHTYSLHDPRDSLRRSSSRSEQQGRDVDMLKSNPLYQTSERPGGSSAQQGGDMYAEVPERATSAGLADDTYEQIPREAAAVQGNTYESLEEMKTEKPKHTWGKNNIKWKKFRPDHKKK